MTRIQVDNFWTDQWDPKETLFRDEEKSIRPVCIICKRLIHDLLGVDT